MMLAAAVVAKLVIIYAGQPPTVVDYPTLARCEAAKRALLEQAKAEQTIGDGIYRVKAYCIPG
jgi:hypothetical protein